MTFIIGALLRYSARLLRTLGLLGLGRKPHLRLELHPIMKVLIHSTSRDRKNQTRELFCGLVFPLR